MFGSIRQALDPARDEAKAYLERQGLKPRVFSGENLGAFFASIPEVARLIAREPEILCFAALQWVVIWLSYLAWTQMLQWIPDEVWNTLRTASREAAKGEFTLINLALLAWSFLIVSIASYPIGICNAAMVAVHDLRASGETVTLVRCLAIAGRHLYRIWMFTTIDAWTTVSAILDRLPKKHYHRTATDELVYYAWKVATMAVVPALVNGRTFIAAGRDSLHLLTTQPARALGLRLGYSAVCWIVGIISYAGGAALFVASGMTDQGLHWLYNFYLLMAAPIFISVGVVSVLVRPFFLLAVAKFYTDLVDVRPEVESDLAAAPSWEKSLVSWHTAVFLLLAAMLAADIFFADQLGITDWIQQLAAQDLAAINR